VEIDTLADHLALQVYGGTLTSNLKHYPNVTSMKQELIDGELDGVFAQKAEVEYLTKDMQNFDTVVPVLPGYGSPSWQIGVAVHHAYRALGYVVDDAIAELITNGRMQQIFASYGVSWVAPER
jgi:ABC-type amino acid transport substrate-binding protein